MLRTQIYLPEALRKEIDSVRRRTGESLSDYFRKAVLDKLNLDKQRKVDLKKLAKEVVGSSTRSRASAEAWIKEIREDRKLADERLEKRWTPTRVKSKKPKEIEFVSP